MTITLNHIKVSRALTAKARHDNPKTIFRECVFHIVLIENLMCLTRIQPAVRQYIAAFGPHRQHLCRRCSTCQNMFDLKPPRPRGATDCAPYILGGKAKRRLDGVRSQTRRENAHASRKDVGSGWRVANRDTRPAVAMRKRLEWVERGAALRGLSALPCQCHAKCLKRMQSGSEDFRAQAGHAADGFGDLGKRLARADGCIRSWPSAGSRNRFARGEFRRRPVSVPSGAGRIA